MVLGDRNGNITRRRRAGEVGTASICRGPEGDSDGSVSRWVIIGHSEPNNATGTWDTHKSTPPCSFSFSGQRAAQRHTSSKALSAERRMPGRGSRAPPSFCHLSTGGGTAWLRHSSATDSFTTTDMFSSSPRMLGGTVGADGEGTPVSNGTPGEATAGLA